MATDLTVLCLNSGSSSLKFALYLVGDSAEAAVADGELDRIGIDGGKLSIRAGGERSERDEHAAGHRAATRIVFAELARRNFAAPDAIGHRVVHGGIEHAAPARVTSELVATLRSLVPLAPLHLPNEIVVIEEAASQYPATPQIACFDTAFHRRMPEIAQHYPLPRRYWDAGVRRFGFHGISYEYIMHALGDDAPPRIVIAHLGNGASLAAIEDGRPVDTTMGFTPAGGLMMGTRAGDIDPGVLVFAMREMGLDADAVDRLVNRESGLIGVSGATSDMKNLLERRASDPAAALAVDLFCRIVLKQIGALVSVLGGLDLLVFTAGIGERAAPIREQVCEGLAYLGVTIDRVRNAAHADTISSATSRCKVRVIATREDLMIARHARRMVTAGHS
ncbi:MAG: acetate/propionate family kinase [Candidatus Binataceae bacterium]